MDQQKLTALTEAVLGRLFVPLEASGRHVHVTAAQAQALFGHSLTPKRPLSQPGQYLANERLTVVGPCGMVKLTEGVMAAQRHIHLNPREAEQFGVKDGQTVRLHTYTDRPVIFEDTVVRVHPNFSAAVHLDYDEANACGFLQGDLGRIEA